jgi:hypothetical protein
MSDAILAYEPLVRFGIFASIFAAITAREILTTPRSENLVVSQFETLDTTGIARPAGADLR